LYEGRLPQASSNQQENEKRSDCDDICKLESIKGIASKAFLLILQQQKRTTHTHTAVYQMLCVCVSEAFHRVGKIESIYSGNSLAAKQLFFFASSVRFFLIAF